MWNYILIQRNLAGSTGQSPFSIVNGYEPLLPVNAAVETALPGVADTLSDMQEIWDSVSQKLTEA